MNKKINTTSSLYVYAMVDLTRRPLGDVVVILKV